MVFLLGANYDGRLLVRKVLTSLYGISSNGVTSTMRRAAPLRAPASNVSNNPSAARFNTLDRLMATHHIHKTARLGELADSTVVRLTGALTGLTIENDARRQVVLNIERMRDMGSTRGRRHAMGLPVRGQRTRTQIKTAKKLNRVERR